MPRPAWFERRVKSPREKIGGTGRGRQRTARPGTRLIDRLSSLGFPTCGKCAHLAREMDAWGADGCRERIDEITDHILANVAEWQQSPAADAASLLARIAAKMPEFAQRPAIRKLVLDAISEVDASLDAAS